MPSEGLSVIRVQIWKISSIAILKFPLYFNNLAQGHLRNLNGESAIS